MGAGEAIKHTDGLERVARGDVGRLELVPLGIEANAERAERLDVAVLLAFALRRGDGRGEEGKCRLIGGLEQALGPISTLEARTE